MTPERWRQITEIVDAAIAREPAARDRFVREACKDDDTLRAAVDELLSAQGKVGSVRRHANCPAGIDSIHFAGTTPMSRRTTSRSPLAHRRIV